MRWKDDKHLIAGVVTVGEQLLAGMPWGVDLPAGPISATRLVSFDPDGGHVKMIGEPAGGFFNRGGTVDRVRYIHPQYQDDIPSILPQSPGRVLQLVLDKSSLAKQTWQQVLMQGSIPRANEQGRAFGASTSPTVDSPI